LEDLPIDLSGLIEEFVVAGEPLVPPILIEVSGLDDQRWEVPHPHHREDVADASGPASAAASVADIGAG
jgi:hypothetical protein